jgi:hypothetical protein
VKIETHYDLDDVLWGLLEDKESGWSVNGRPVKVIEIETHTAVFKDIGGTGPDTLELYICDDHRKYSSTHLFIVKDDAEKVVLEMNDFNEKYKAHAKTKAAMKPVPQPALPFGRPEIPQKQVPATPEPAPKPEKPKNPVAPWLDEDLKF